MDMKFMDEYYEGIRADNIETLIKQNSDEWESCEKQLNKAWDDFLNGLGIAHIFYKDINYLGMISKFGICSLNWTAQRRACS